MQHKTLAIADHEPELKKIADELISLRDLAKQRISFFKKQYEDFLKQEDEKTKPLWDQVEEYFRKNGRLPADYTKAKYSIHFDWDDGTICLHDNSEEVPGFIRNLLKT